MRSNCDADQSRQAKNNSDASGTIPITTSADGKSPIDSSNVAIESVTSETMAAASTPARTEGLAVTAVVSAPAIVRRALPKNGGLNAPLTITGPTIVRDDGPPPLSPRAGRGRCHGSDLAEDAGYHRGDPLAGGQCAGPASALPRGQIRDRFHAPKPADQLDRQPEIRPFRGSFRGQRDRCRHPGSL